MISSRCVELSKNWLMQISACSYFALVFAYFFINTILNRTFSYAHKYTKIHFTYTKIWGKFQVKLFLWFSCLCKFEFLPINQNTVFNCCCLVVRFAYWHYKGSMTLKKISLFFKKKRKTNLFCCECEMKEMSALLSLNFLIFQVN